MRHQDGRGTARRRTPSTRVLLDFEQSVKREGQPRRMCPSDQLVATSTSICTGFLRYNVHTRAHRAHANLLLGKARDGPPTLAPGPARPHNGKLPLPNPGCSGSPSITENQPKRRHQSASRRQPRGSAGTSSLSRGTPGTRDLPSASAHPAARRTKAAQRQPRSGVK